MNDLTGQAADAVCRRTGYTNFGIDTVLSSGTDSARYLYANGHHVRDPYLSPIHGDFGKGFPPTILA